jgi:hypothetical protein
MPGVKEISRLFLWNSAQEQITTLLPLNGVDGLLSFYCLEGEPDRSEDSISITALAEYL